MWSEGGEQQQNWYVGLSKAIIFQAIDIKFKIQSFDTCDNCTLYNFIDD